MFEDKFLHCMYVYLEKKIYTYTQYAYLQVMHIIWIFIEFGPIMLQAYYVKQFLLVISFITYPEKDNLLSIKSEINF